MNGSSSFDAFYADYLQQHRHPANRALHLLAKAAMLGALATAIGGRTPWPLLLVPVVGVTPCWLGHWLFEGNRPTSRTQPDASLLGTLAARLTRRPAASSGGRPWYSFAADLRMCAAMLAGERRRGVERG